jgi:SpoVK/Ycf46/Vps4 family AAA+-type ATPase
MKPLLGDSEKSILTIFKVAYENSPCIVCFEDADTWCENNEANEFSQPSSVTVRLTTELLRQLDELRFNYVFKNIPCPVLVLLLTNTTENHEKKFHSNFYQPHRQGKRILLPLLKYWKTEDFVTIFFNQFNEPLINCESNEKDQNTCFSVVCEIFTNNIHHLKSPAAVKKLINTIHQLKLRRFTKLNATFCKNRMENNTTWSQHSICMCDIIDAFKKIA